MKFGVQETKYMQKYATVKLRMYGYRLEPHCNSCAITSHL